MRIPIISRFQPEVTPGQLEHARSTAGSINQEDHRFDLIDESFNELVLKGPIENEPTLHLDDFSEIPVIGKVDTSAVAQQRARLRATDGDWVVQSRKVEPGYSDYCEFRLGLGRVNWLYPSNDPHDPHKIALECWRDRRVRHDLIQAVRQQGLRHIHPHVSTLYVWELASLLAKATRLPIKVVGPTPALSRWANDKIEFSRAVARLLGPDMVPQTESAYNFATLGKTVMRLAATNVRLGIKFPYGTGGSGNFQLRSSQVKGMKLAQVREFLKHLLANHRWPQGGRVLIDAWETNVVASPSVQTWIPAKGQGEPVIEGLFRQSVVGDECEFVGSCPIDLPARLERQIVDGSYLLAVLFQELGYIGRCSFDLIIVGEDISDSECRVEFIECNARWGGTSIPMTLMNRLGVPDAGKTWRFRQIRMPGLDQLHFAEILRHLGDSLFDRRAKHGHFILLNPGRIHAHAAIDAIAIGDTRDEVNHLIDEVLQQQLGSLIDVEAIPANDPPVSEFLLGHADFESA